MKCEKIETVDKTFRDIMDVDEPFDEKVIIFGGNFYHHQYFQNRREQRL